MRILSYVVAAILGATIAVGLCLAIIRLGLGDKDGSATPAEDTIAGEKVGTFVQKPADDNPPLITELPLQPLNTESALSIERARPETRPATYADLLKGIGGEKVATILRAPDKVEAVLLKPPDWKRQYQPHQYLVASETVKVDSATAKDIADSLLTPELHTIILAAKGCLPIYGVRVTYWSGDDRVDLNFCFECAILMVYLSGEAVGGMSFDTVLELLKNDAIKIFPAEPGLKNLRDRTKDGLTPIPSPEDGFGPPVPPVVP